MAEEKEVLNIDLNYEDNLPQVTKKFNKAIKEQQAIIKKNNAYIEAKAKLGEKITKHQEKLVENKKKENLLAQNTLRTLEKQAPYEKALAGIRNSSMGKILKQTEQQTKLQGTILKQMEMMNSTLARLNVHEAKSVSNKKAKVNEIHKEIKATDKLTKAEQKRAEAEAKAQRRSKAQRSFGGSFDPEFSTSLSHKVGTTLQYVAAGVGIMSVAQAVQALGQNVVETDLNMRTMAAVLDLSVPRARILSESVRELGETYGGSLESIDQVALSLGRAGIAADKVVTATEVVIQMARLTGDTFEQSADAIISFQQVFGNTTSIESLGNKLAYVANVSRLSTKDIGTFSNFALAAAKSAGLTEDAVGGLAAAFSNAGVNASTIGTQIRTFTGILNDSSGGVTSFFEGIGISQERFAQRMREGGAASNKALLEFIDTLKEMDDSTFNNVTAGMNKLTTNVIQLMRNNSKNINKFVTDLEGGVEGQLASVDKILEAYAVKIQSTWNTIQNTFEEGFNSLADGIERNSLKSVIEDLEKTKTLQKFSLFGDGWTDKEEKVLSKSKDMLELYDLMKAKALTQKELEEATGASREALNNKLVEQTGKLAVLQDKYGKSKVKSSEDTNKAIQSEIDAFNKALSALKQSGESTKENTAKITAYSNAIEKLNEKLKKTGDLMSSGLLSVQGADIPARLSSIVSSLDKGFEVTAMASEGLSKAIVEAQKQATAELEVYYAVKSKGDKEAITQVKVLSDAYQDEHSFRQQMVEINKAAAEYEKEFLKIKKSGNEEDLKTANEARAYFQDLISAGNKVLSTRGKIAKLDDKQKTLKDALSRFRDKTLKDEQTSLDNEARILELTEANNKVGEKKSLTLKRQLDSLRATKVVITDTKALQERSKALIQLETKYKQQLLKEQKEGNDARERADKKAKQAADTRYEDARKQFKLDFDNLNRLNAIAGVDRQMQDLQKYGKTNTPVSDARDAEIELEAKLENARSNGLETAQLELDLKKAQLEVLKEQVQLKQSLSEIEILGNSEMERHAKNILPSIEGMGQAYRDNQKVQEKEGSTAKERADAEQKYTKATIRGYANIAGAASQFFDQGSKEAQYLITIQSALATVNAVNAILTQGAVEPFTAFARMAAMAVTAGALLANIGKSIKMSNTSESFDAHSAMKANEGVGSVLGDSEAQSESISNSLSILEDFAKPEFALMSQMTKSLISIEQNIGGLTGNIIKQGGFALGEGANLMKPKGLGLTFDKAFSSGMSNLDFMDIPGLNIILDATNFAGQMIGKVAGGLFGKTSQSLSDSGLTFSDQLLPSALENLQGQSYQAITTTKKSWFKKSSSTSTRFQGLDRETESQFELVLNNLYNTALLAGEGLDTSTSAIEQDLSDFVVRIGKISLKGKSGEEIQKTLTSIFGKIGDDIARDAFPALDPFQKVGEGMFETMTRVAVGMEEAEFYINRLGNAFDDINYTSIENKQGDVSFEALTQSIIEFEKRAYGANSSLIAIIESLSGTAQESFDVYQGLDNLRDRLKFLKQDIQGLTSTMLLGAGGIDALESGFADYFEGFLTDSEQLAYRTEAITKEFNKLNVALPVSKDAFKDLINGIDLSTESGQELYGRLIILSGAFGDVADSVKESIENLEQDLGSVLDDAFNPLMSTLDEMFNRITSMADSALGVIGNIKDDQRSEFDTLVEYNKLIEQFAGSKDEDTFNSILKLSQTLTEDSKYNQDILGYLEDQVVQFDKDKDVLKVTLVDAIGMNLGLTTDQKGQLQMAIADGVLTQDEIAGMSLSDKQKESLVTVADNSAFFSTEDTLSALNLLAIKQLEALTKTEEAETESLSSKTFEYGNYVGTQEKIDIAKTLGVSYETAQPLVEKLQNLSVSKNPLEDLKGLLGSSVGGTTVNKSVVEQLRALSPYVGKVENIMDGKYDLASLATFAEKSAEQNKYYSDIQRERKAAYDKEWGEWISAKSAALKLGDIEAYETSPDSKSTGGTGGWFIRYNSTPSSEAAVKNAKALADKEQADISAAFNLWDRGEGIERTWMGFSSGGYTGAGGKYDPAGMVHKGEYVLNQQQLRDQGGVRGLEAKLSGTRSDNTDIVRELVALRQEYSTMKILMVKLAANSTKQLNTQRGILAQGE